MHILLLYLIITIPIFANSDGQEVLKELKTLAPIYKEYKKSLQKQSDTIESIEKEISKNSLSKSNISLLNNTYQFKIFPLDFFDSNSNLSDSSTDDKIFLADRDLAKINASIFMISNILYNQTTSTSKRKQQKAFKNIFKSSEYKLLNLANKALKASPLEAEILDMQFNLIIQHLSSIPFPPKYSFYRRRMMFSIANPQAAQDQINRIKQSLLNIK